LKSEDGHAISRQGKTPVTQKISSKEKKPSPPPHRVALGLPSPSPKVCKGERTYADVTTKIPRVDRLPNFFTHGAPHCTAKELR